MAAHNDLGRWGEMIARRFLIFHDYHIRSFDWRDGHHELDIVAEKLGFLVFVEVKTRSTLAFGDPLEAIDRRKVQKYRKMAEEYIIRRRLFDKDVRFDAVGIVGDSINYVPDAF